MPRKNLKKVFSLWTANLAGNGDSKNTIWTDGTTIFSYAMPLMVRMPSGIVLCKHGEAPTVTTSTQRNALAYLLSTNKIPFKEVTASDVKLARNMV